MDSDIRFSLFNELPRIVVPVPGREEEVKLDLLTLNDFIYEWQENYDATNVAGDDPNKENMRLIARDSSLTASFKAYILPQLGMPAHLVPDMAINRMMDLVITKTTEYLKEQRALDDAKKKNSSIASSPTFTQESLPITVNGTIEPNQVGYSTSGP